jgi:hypothetical protein
LPGIGSQYYFGEILMKFSSPSTTNQPVTVYRNKNSVEVRNAKYLPQTDDILGLLQGAGWDVVQDFPQMFTVSSPDSTPYSLSILEDELIKAYFLDKN